MMMTTTPFRVQRNPGWMAFLAFVFVGCLCFKSNAGIKNVGLPFINNYPKTVYDASTQNWAITQNHKGFMYFGNNDGLLEFDGNNWQLYRIPNFSILRSIMAVGDTIYTGAFEELGYFVPDQTGMLQYHSLTHLVPQTYSVFDEIWRIFKTSQGIVFQSFRYVFLYNGERIQVIEPPSDFSLSYVANDAFYIVDREVGLMRLKDGSLERISNDPVFFNNEVRCILEYGADQVIIGTNNDGLFLFDGQTLRPWNNPLNRFLQQHTLFAGLRLSNGHYVFGTVQNGIYIVNQDGEVVQHINRFKGLQNNTILSLFEDRRNNLWLGLDNGIDYIELSSPLSILDYNYSLESTYSSIVFEGRLYVGTNQGLYVMDMEALSAPDTPSKSFELIPGTEGQVWNLQEINGDLFCGHNFGCFLIEGFTATKLSDHTGFWYFIPYGDQKDTILAGTYTGLSWLRKSGGQWTFMGELKGFSESSRFMVQEDDGSIWISHGYRGLFRVMPGKNLQSVESVKLFGPADGLPGELPYNIQWIDRELVVTTRNGIYGFDPEEQRFVPHAKYDRIFGDYGFIDKIHKDRDGNLWYFTTTSMGVFRLLEDGSYKEIHSPFYRINSMLLPSFENILTHDKQNVFIGSQNGLIHYDASIIRDVYQAEPVYIREVSFQGKGGQTTLLNPSNDQSTVVPFASNSVVFRYATPAFEEPGHFSYRLSGFETDWSPWETIKFKEYTNLREGDYIFELKAMNAYREESPSVEFHFTVQPPLLRSTVAYLVYGAVIFLLIAANVIYWRRRLARTRFREKFKHQLKLEQQEIAYREESLRTEKEIIKLRNESLQSAMGHKTRELANSTMHLMQKNKVLTSIRSQLVDLVRSGGDEEQRFQINNLIKKINKDLRNEKYREVFNAYFDEIHQDFIKRLKEKHPDLSPKELRLCAYLRMNLSTKEIAPLMNISIRGVEISRYRLRKKLDLDRDTNLIDFILDF